METEKLVKLYIDCMRGGQVIKVDDFIVAVGQKQSNSVYHVAEVRQKTPSPKNERMTRFYVKCYKSNLITCLSRDNDQSLIPITWYKRPKKKPKQ